MSDIYHNWERLVAAVMKREEIRQLCLESSRTISISPLSSNYPSPYSPFDDISSNIIESGERIEQYEPGVYITLLVHEDGTKEVIRAKFSSTKFKRTAAETWWLDNREKVYTKYNDEIGLARIRRLSFSAWADSGNKDESFDKIQQYSYETSNELLISQYKPGVYIFLAASSDGSTEFRQVCFSRKRFKEQEAKAWWLKNRDKVYEKHNIRVKLDSIKHPLVSTQGYSIDQEATKCCCLRIRSFRIDWSNTKYCLKNGFFCFVRNFFNKYWC